MVYELSWSILSVFLWTEHLYFHYIDYQNTVSSLILNCLFYATPPTGQVTSPDLKYKKMGLIGTLKIVSCLVDANISTCPGPSQVRPSIILFASDKIDYNSFDIFFFVIFGNLCHQSSISLFYFNEQECVFINFMSFLISDRT